MKLIGHLQIIKVKDGIETTHYESRNAISDGVSIALTDLMLAAGSSDTADYEVSYFQLGNGSLSGYLPPGTTNNNFFRLASPLGVNDYGSSSIQAPILLDQLVSPDGNFTTYNQLTASANYFISIPSYNKSTILESGINLKLLVDEDLANGVDITEVGLFLKNPTGKTIDAPVMLAYKTFPAINKEPGTRVIIIWNIVAEDSSYSMYSSLGYSVDSIVAQAMLQNYVNATVDLVSGLPTIANASTRDNFSDRFDILVPSAYSAAGAPLLVYFHDIGDQVDNFVTASALAAQLNARNWFGVAPLGRSTTNINDDSAAGLYPHSKAMLYGMNSLTALNHTRKVVQYMLDRYPIDPNRIYFYGYGTGGGCALSFASLLTDNRRTAWYPAALISHDGVLSNRFTWWYYAPSALTSPSGDYPTPPNATMQLPAKATSFWSVSSVDLDGPISHIPAELTGDGVNGTDWAIASSITPTTRPFRFIETSPVDFNLNTSSDLWLSTCTLLNLTHVPMYIHWVTNSPSGPPVTLPNTILSSYMSSGLYSEYFTTVFQTGSTGAHNLSTINLTSALDFCASKTRTDVTSAITCVTRDGYYWGFQVSTLVENHESQSGWFISNNTDSSEFHGVSGLAFMWWSKNYATKTLTFSGEWLIYNDTFQCIDFDPADLGFSPLSHSSPLTIITLSGIDTTASAGGFTWWNSLEFPHPWFEKGTPPHQIRRMCLLGVTNPVYVKYAAEIAEGAFEPYFSLVHNGTSWRKAGALRASDRSGNGAPAGLLLIRKGKYEIV